MNYDIIIPRLSPLMAQEIEELLVHRDLEWEKTESALLKFVAWDDNSGFFIIEAEDEQSATEQLEPYQRALGTYEDIKAQLKIL